MERYTFEEIRLFNVGDIFYTRQRRYRIDTVPIYYSTSDFYGDNSEKLEWTAICETEGDELNRQTVFVSQKEETDRTHLIFKTMG